MSPGTLRRAGRGRQDVGSGLGSREVLVGCSAAGDVSRMWADCQLSCLTTFDVARCMKKPDSAADRQRLVKGSEHRADGSEHRADGANIERAEVNIERMEVNIERMEVNRERTEVNLERMFAYPERR